MARSNRQIRITFFILFTFEVNGYGDGCPIKAAHDGIEIGDELLTDDQEFWQGFFLQFVEAERIH